MSGKTVVFSKYYSNRKKWSFVGDYYRCSGHTILESRTLCGDLTNKETCHSEQWCGSLMLFFMGWEWSWLAQSHGIHQALVFQWDMLTARKIENVPGFILLLFLLKSLHCWEKNDTQGWISLDYTRWEALEEFSSFPLRWSCWVFTLWSLCVSNYSFLGRLTDAAETNISVLSTDR